MKPNPKSVELPYIQSHFVYYWEVTIFIGKYAQSMDLPLTGLILILDIARSDNQAFTTWWSWLHDTHRIHLPIRPPFTASKCTAGGFTSWIHNRRWPSSTFWYRGTPYLLVRLRRQGLYQMLFLFLNWRDLKVKRWHHHLAHLHLKPGWFSGQIAAIKSKLSLIMR